MFCSKCGKQLDDDKICTYCGAKAKESNLSNPNAVQVMLKGQAGRKYLLFIAAFFLLLECILILHPVVEIRSELLAVNKQFGLFDFENNDSKRVLIIAAHCLSFFMLVVPGVMRVEVKGGYVIPSILTSSISVSLVSGAALKMDELVSKQYVSEILDITHLDVCLTTNAVILLIISVATLMISTYIVYKANGKHIKTDLTSEANEEVRNKYVSPNPSSKDIKEFFVLLVVLCVVTSIGIAIPSVVRNAFAKSIVGEWYAVDQNTGNVQTITFHSDNTCEINDYPVSIYWDVRDGEIVLKEQLGEEYAYEYEWEGNELIINGFAFSRNPNH